MSKCSICLESFSTSIAMKPEIMPLLLSFDLDADGIYATQCGHLFHCGCILDWIDISFSCPLCPICKKRILIDKLLKVYLNIEPDYGEELHKENHELKKKLNSTSDRLSILKDNVEQERTRIDTLTTHLQDQKNECNFLEGKLKDAQYKLAKFEAQRHTLKSMERLCEDLYSIENPSPILNQIYCTGSSEGAVKRLRAFKESFTEIISEREAFREEIFHLRRKIDEFRSLMILFGDRLPKC